MSDFLTSFKEALQARVDAERELNLAVRQSQAIVEKAQSIADAKQGDWEVDLLTQNALFARALRAHSSKSKAFALADKRYREVLESVGLTPEMVVKIAEEA